MTGKEEKAHAVDMLDVIDRKILRLLQGNCHLKAEVIATSVGLSPSAVQRRAKRFRDEKVIIAEIAVIDRKAVGPLMTFVAGLEIERENYQALARFKKWVAKQEEIQQAYYVTGNIDVILIITAANVEEYDHISARIMAQHPQIRRINTSVVLNTLKIGLDVPLDDLSDEPS